MVQVLFGLFGLSFFISKSAFTLLYTVVILFGLAKFDWSAVSRLPFLEKVLIGLFPLAIALSFFSLGGSRTALEVLSRWTWPLIYFPILYLHENKTERTLFFKGLGLSLFVACLYSYIRFSSEFNFDSNARVSSFWDILRWAYFLAVSITVLFSILIKPQLLEGKTWKFGCLLLVMAVTSLVLTASRGAWMGALAGTFCVLISQRKSFKYYLGYFVLVFLILFSNTGIRHRILSSFDIKREQGKITSEDGSNAGRLHMWKVALDLYQEVPFFGVGFHNSKTTLKEFIEKKGPDYAEKFTKVEYSYNDQHSSYMTLLLQFGGIYFVFIYGFFLVVTYKCRRDEIYLPAMMCTYIVYFFYSAIVSFEAVVIFGLTSFMILKLRKIPII